jgi:hypothetical protein
VELKNTLLIEANGREFDSAIRYAHRYELVKQDVVKQPKATPKS